MLKSVCRWLRNAGSAIIFQRIDRSRRGIPRFAKLDIFGYIDQYRARTSSASQPERLVYRVCQVFNTLDQKIMLGDGLCHTQNIGFLKGITPDKWTRYLPGDGNDRGRIHKRRCQSRHQVGCAWAARCHTHAYFTSCASITISGMRCGLFVADENMSQFRVGGERIIKGHNRATRIAVEQIYAFPYQGLAKNSTPWQFTRFMLRNLRCVRSFLLLNCRCYLHSFLPNNN